MGKKKNTKAVVVTIIITLIVLAGLSYAGVRYLLPIYTQGQNGSGDAMADVYKFAVKLFPLLVGIVLIIIASMIASSREDDEDEDDKLPPNSYDNQLFEEPNDDPVSKKSAPAVKSEPEFTPEEEQQFVSIFDAPVAEVTEPAEPEFKGIVEEEPAAVEEESVAAAPEETVPARSPEKEDALVQAIYCLVKKLDDMTEMSLDDVDFDEDDFVEDDEEEEFEELDSVEVPQCAAGCNISALEDKVNSLCDIVTNLSELVANKHFQMADVEETEEEEVVEEEVPETEEDPVSEEVVEAAEEEQETAEEAPVEEETPVEAEAEAEAEPEIEIEEPAAANDVERFARIEFDCAQEDGYDISFVFTDASMDDVALNLSGLGDAFEVNGKTFIVVPFLSNDEIKFELEKLDAPYELKTIVGGEKADFDEVIGSKIR